MANVRWGEHSPLLLPDRFQGILPAALTRFDRENNLYNYLNRITRGRTGGCVAARVLHPLTPSPSSPKG